MIAYFIKVVAFQLLFLLTYDLFLKKETFFNWNRAYLICSSLLSFALPFIKIESFQNAVPQEYVILLPEIVLTPEKTVAPIEPAWNWFLIIGIAVSSFLFIYKITQLIRLRFKGRIVKYDDYTIIHIPKSTLAFSIFRYVFIGEHIEETKREDILLHELVHVREKHSLDLLYFELLRILCWFNPLVYIYQKRISELHEYIADANIVKDKNKSDYYEKLLTEVFQTQQFSFTNQFFKHSLIKKRIIMLTKQKSREILKLKYLVLVPVLIFSLVYTSCKSTTTVVDTKEVTAQTETVEEVTTQEKSMPTVNTVSELNSDLVNNEKLTQEEHVQQADLSTEVAQVTAEDEISLENNEVQSYVDNVATIEKQMDEVQNINEPSEERKIANIDNDKAYSVVNDVATIEKQMDEVQNINESSEERKIANIDNDKAYSVKDVDKLPVYPGCETTRSKEELKTCLAESVQKHMLQNFNMKVAEDSGLKGKQKISAQFVIGKNGKVSVTELEAPSVALSAETKRVIEALPVFIPAQKGGKPVSVKYAIPIIFKIQ